MFVLGIAISAVFVSEIRGDVGAEAARGTGSEQ